MHRKLTRLSATLLLALGAVPAGAVPLVDQFQLNGADQNQAIHSIRPIGQTFTAGQTGRLTGLELSLFESGDGPGLTIEILDFSGGDLTTAPTLGSVTIQETDLGPAPDTLALGSVTATFIDLSSLGINITAGDAMGFRLSSDRVNDPNVGAPLFAMKIAFNDPYLAGDFFVGTEFVDIGGVPLDAAFKTFVDVPAPATAALLALGLLGMGFTRRR